MDTPTTVPELRRLLDAKQEAGRRLREAFADGLSIGRLRIEYDRLWDVLENVLTDGTLVAMLTGLEAAEEMAWILRGADITDVQRFRATCLEDALAPLFPKEATDA
jgi:hypothetical protein